MSTTHRPQLEYSGRQWPYQQGQGEQRSNERRQRQQNDEKQGLVGMLLSSSISLSGAQFAEGLNPI